ncbi:ATP-binding protein [Clostridium estertheticum]|uniref:AAA family ATPase n=1 Tax=Clostridium estertheticum TaxID=238834 RepID=UPI0013E97DE3|nr:AAA family ATPase [Clostridium estertheticum]MBZ9685874.1 ATP-binding protein [Clostridium estertheticum]
MGKVIVFRGKAGVGKTTISNEIGRILNIPIIRKDDIYDSIANYIDNHELRNKACYNTLYKIVETNILNNLDVIVDAGFHYLEQALQFKTWVLNKNAIFVPLLCICSDEKIWAERFDMRRHNPQPNNLITDFRELKLHYKDLKTDSLKNEKILDTIYSIDSLVESALLEVKKH